VTIPDFTWATFNPAVPPGTLSNTISTDRDGVARIGPGIPGAYVLSTPVVASGFLLR